MRLTPVVAAVTTAVLAASALAGVVGAADATVGGSGGPVPTGPAAAVGFRTVQANLESTQTTAHFKADLATITKQSPDFMTLNEVAHRSDTDLTPAGYGMYRVPGMYTGETAVLWRTDRWAPVDEGIATVSNKHGVPPGKKVELGLRYATWVTLESADGRIVTVVSTHFVPPISGWPDLTATEVRNLGALTNTLAQRGPVYVGGDLNVPYRSTKFPRAQLAGYNLVATYDLLGWAPATGQHVGATIDYQLVGQQPGTTSPTAQYTTDLNSDHLALTTDWAFNTPAPNGGLLPSSGARFVPTTVLNHPRSRASTSRRAVLRLVTKAINNAPRWSAVHLVTAGLNDKTTLIALQRAQRRGVKVQVVERSTRLNPMEKALRKQLGADTRLRTWFAGCTSKICKATVKTLPPTVLLISQAGQTTAVRVNVTRPLDQTAVKRPTRGVLRNDLPGYNKIFHTFFLLVG